ncbi:MAG TPA: hypothetical protein VK524_34540, partial [Polyangiaceae bacterium]|nr:hypothetical protein [Polyangiaceae bacterium]
FGEGPWIDELDTLEWKRRDLHCVVKRHSQLGYLQGFVGVPETHPFFGKWHTDVASLVDVHGGLVYSAGCSHCGIWWFGFDCGHAFDVMPAIAKAVASYKNLEFVRQGVDMLAVQLLMIERGEMP